ncbi:hypothetical protein [Nonomuraea salmonea]|uniref:hypothetical protein n=1 Tax=Nonomuraea salmonea TaxID=46181 RepID=UPI002FECAA04
MPKAGAIAEAQAAGHIDPAFDPADVHAMVIALAMTWSPAGIIYTATEDDPEAEHNRRRAALAAAVHRAFTPPPRGPDQHRPPRLRLRWGPDSHCPPRLHPPIGRP